MDMEKINAGLDIPDFLPEYRCKVCIEVINGLFIAFHLGDVAHDGQDEFITLIAGIWQKAVADVPSVYLRFKTSLNVFA